MTEVQRLAKIMVLKDLFKEYELLAKYNGGTDYDRYCALEMAIKELEQEPTTKNDKEQEDITWIIGNDNVQIAVRNMPVDMMQKICSIIGQEVRDKE